MSGTILLGPTTSVDVRTVDFLRIVAALRAEGTSARTACRLLETVDGFGMNMLCADELDAAGRAEFAEVLRKLQDSDPSDDGDFHRFLTDLRRRLTQDERLDPPASVPAPWRRYLDEQDHGRRLALLTAWSGLAAAWPSVLDFLRTQLQRLIVAREPDDTAALLYRYTVDGTAPNVFRGRAPVAAVPERLRPIWDRVPATLRDFYTQLHDGWTFQPTNSMGPLPLEDWAFLSGDRFDIDDATARALPIDPALTVAVFHNGAGDYLCLDCAGHGEASGVIWWHEDPAHPEAVDFWGVLDAWVGIFLEEADRHRA